MKIVANTFEFSYEKFRSIADSPRGAHLRPILDAVVDADVDLNCPVLGTTGLVQLRRRYHCIVLIGDDPVRDGAAVGPDGFPDLTEVFAAAHFVTVMSGAPIAELYEGAAAAAVAGYCVVLIETQLCRHVAWATLAAKKAPDAAYFDIMPRLGGVQ